MFLLLLYTCSPKIYSEKSGHAVPVPSLIVVYFNIAGNVVALSYSFKNIQVLQKFIHHGKLFRPNSCFLRS